MRYNVNEIFVSFQGEGPSVGRPAVFVRFAGCNVQCSFCDTNHDAVLGFDTPAELASRIEFVMKTSMFPPELFVGFRCVFTGGEPLLQLDEDLVSAVKKLGFLPCIETNGMRDTVESSPSSNLGELLDECHEVVVSPKGSKYSEEILAHATCLKLLFPYTEEFDFESGEIRDMVDWVGVDRPDVVVSDLVVQPITPANKVFGNAWHQACTRAMHFMYARRQKFGEDWRVIPQTHVFMGCR